MLEPRQVFRAAGYAAGAGTAGTSAAFCRRCGAALDARDADAACAACGHREYRNAAPAVSVLVPDGATVLLCRRAPSSFQGGRWCLPCGFVDHDEDFLTAGRREVREETGLDVEIASIISVVTNFHTPALHSLVIVLQATAVGGRLVAGDDADAAAWFAPSDVPDLAFEADRHIIDRWFAQPGYGAPVDPRYAR